jgi:5-methylcytosine-specific restriction endonuclease McrA
MGTSASLTTEQRERKRERDRAYRQANRDRLRDYFRQHYSAHREERAQYDRERRLADPATAAARVRAWRERHPDRLAEHRRAWGIAEPLRALAARTAVTANRRARMRGAEGRIGYRIVLNLWQRQPVCVDCGEGRGLDHVIPLSRGGANTPDNLANRCRHCNNRKGAKVA